MTLLEMDASMLVVAMPLSFGFLVCVFVTASAAAIGTLIMLFAGISVSSWL